MYNELGFNTSFQTRVPLLTTCHHASAQKPVRILQKSPEEKAKEKAEPDPGNLGKMLRWTIKNGPKMMVLYGFDLPNWPNLNHEGLMKAVH